MHMPVALKKTKLRAALCMCVYMNILAPTGEHTQIFFLSVNSGVAGRSAVTWRKEPRVSNYIDPEYVFLLCDLKLSEHQLPCLWKVVVMIVMIPVNVARIKQGHACQEHIGCQHLIIHHHN